MNENLLQFQTADGSPIFVEISDSRSGYRGGNTRSGTPSLEIADKRFREVLSTVSAIATEAMETIDNMVTKPDEISLELGIKITAEAGVLVTRLGGEAHLQITLTWKKSA